MLIASEHTLRYKEAATCFNEALPLGNGRIGAMIYGGTVEEKISLNEDTLWSGYPRAKRNEGYASIYQKGKQLFDEGKQIQAQKLLEEGFGDHLVQMYLPLAELRIKLGHAEEENYSRILRLDRSIHTVSYVIAGKKYTRETFVSEPHQVVAIRFQCSEKASICFCATLKERLTGSQENTVKDTVLICGTAPNAIAEYGTCYKAADSQVYDGNGISYACAFHVKAVGGKVRNKQGLVEVENADEVILYLGARTNYKDFKQLPSGKEHVEQCLSDVQKAAALDYERLKKESIRAHRRLYNRSQISLGEGTMTRVSTDVRIKRLAEGKEDNGLYALLFNFGKYVTIAGSRSGTQPMNLQGIWNDRLLPPWNCNYTLNINTEMNYWPTLTMGLFECYEPLVRFAEELAESGKETAKMYYGVENAWVCHHSSDLWRLTHPGTNRIQGNAQWGFWNMASGWLSVMLWNYYRYTLDKKYLKRVYSVMEGAARFYKELLAECDGKLILPLSTSPENNYILDDATAIEDAREEACAIDKSTAMSQEILYDLFTAVSQASLELGVTDEYGALISKLQRPEILSNGELGEWHTNHQAWDIHHRHVSHLYGLFPSNQFKSDRKRMKACEKALVARGDAGTGWSLAWKINLWARLGNAEQALQLLNSQLRLVATNEEERDSGGGSYPNLFCAHPPFQIDGNLGAANGIIEMLLQFDDNGTPILLPALPKQWKNGSVSNLRMPGNSSISFAWENGQILWCKVKEESR